MDKIEKDPINYHTYQKIKPKLKRKNKLSLVIDDFESEMNVAHIFRLSDAFIVDHIYILSERSYPWKKILKLSRSTSNKIDYSQMNINQYLGLNHGQNTLIGLEWTEQSQSISSYESNEQSIHLILGNERFGVNPILLNACDYCIHIPMYGINSSMNVAMAAGIAVAQISL